MTMRILTTLSLLALGACASYSNDYQQRLLHSLPNQRDVTFADQKSYPGAVLCGQYTSLTGGGFSLVTRPFVVTADRIMASPSQDEQRIYCSRDAASALFARKGIGPSNGDWNALAKVGTDMRAISTAITHYYDSNHVLPPNLGALESAIEELSADMLVDPWGNPYSYRSGLSGRTTPRYDLATLGSDGKPGGEGDAADVDEDDLHLLEHVLKLR